MRDSGGRGQGPGRGGGGAGSQGGPGAARRTPGGPGRAGRPGTGRAASPDDPFHLPFGDTPRSRGGSPADDDVPDDDPAPGGPRRPRPGQGRPRRGDDDLPAGGPHADERSRGRTSQRGGSRRGEDDLPAGGPHAEERSRGRAGQRDGEASPGGARGGSARGERFRRDESDHRRDAGPSRGRAGQRDTEARPDDAFRRRPSDTARRPPHDRSRGDGDARGRDDGSARRTQADNPVRRPRDEDAGRARPGEGPRAATRAGTDAGGRGGTRVRAGEGARRDPQDGARPRAGGGGRKPPPPPKPPLVLRLGSPKRRISIGLIAMTFILSIFAGRLIQMQGLDSKVYEAAATKQRLHVEKIPAKRGSITDVNGHNLALTVEARDISIDPSKIPAEVRQGVASLLARTLGRPVEEMAAKLARTDTRYQLLARGVAPPVADRLLKEPVPSLNATSTFRRVYPGGDLAGSLIGFVGDDKDGLTGIEQVKNTALAGTDGELQIETGRDLQRIPMTGSQRTPPVDGRDVRLTIDRDIQWAAQKAIGEQVESAGASSGTVIVMDVRTADVIAMANAPELDLANWREAPESHYLNRAAADVFEPGSTNKVITAAAALEAGVVDSDTVFHVKDNIQCYDRVLRDAHAHPPEDMTFAQAMAQSSNVATVMAARRVGSEGLYDMLKAFGFGTKPGGDMPGAGAGLLPHHDKWSGSQSCTIAYGQGVSVTALQMASVYQTIANGGVKVEPRIVAGTTAPDGTFTPAKPGKKTRVISTATAKEITAMLEDAVGAQGTGELAAIPGYRVAGKTGTANRYDADLGRYDGYTASFAGFTPADAPRLVVLSVLQNPKNGHYGGQIAAPVFKDVMTFALKSRKIPPTGSAASPARAGAEQ
ncbi:penicillin-binding transpeptidase domain-containing protein [Nonomuraea sp. NPDC050478]